MEQEKIASRLILADGTTFNIGTVGAVENVAVKLSAHTSEDWASMKVVVQDITDGANNGEYQLNALGEVKFFIPMGHTYSVMLPIVEGYTQPLIITLTAQLASRVITHEYTMSEVQYEQINISAQVVGGDVVELDGEIVTIKTDSGLTYAETFTNGSTVLRVPYGEHYRIYTPNLDGYTKDGLNLQFNSGIPSRFIRVHYTEGLFGFFGIDDDGNQYSIEQIESMQQEERSTINYIGYNDSSYALEDRGDGTLGNGFIMHKSDYYIIGTTLDKGVFISTLPVIDKNEAKYNHKSAYNTDAFLRAEAIDGVYSDLAHKSNDKKVTIGGVERRGLWAAPGVFVTVKQNINTLNYILELIGGLFFDDFKSHQSRPACAISSNAGKPTVVNYNSSPPDYFYTSVNIVGVYGAALLIYDL